MSKTSPAKLQKIDWLIALGLAAVFFVSVYLPLGSRVAQSAAVQQSDLLFAADAPRVVKDLALFEGDGAIGHWRTVPHPLFVIVLNPIGVTLAQIFGQEKSAAIMLAAAGGIAAALAYFVILAIGLRRDSAVLLAIVLGCSGSHLVFAVVPETYIFSAAVLMFLMLALVRWPGKPVPFVAGGVLALGFLITNFAQAGLLYAASMRGGGSLTVILKRLIIGGACVLGIAVVLNIAQRQIYPGAGLFFLPGGVKHELRYVEWPHTIGGWLERARNLAQTMTLTNFIIPEPQIISPGAPPRPPSVGLRANAIQHIWPIGWLGMILVTGLWVGTIWSLFHHRLWRDRLVGGLLLCLAFNFLLHMFYGIGPELYLYSCGWTGLVVVLWARCWREWLTDSRRVMFFNVAAAGLAIVCLGNSVHFMEACLKLW